MGAWAPALPRGEDAETYDAMVACGCTLCEEECHAIINEDLCNGHWSSGICTGCMQELCVDQLAGCKATKPE